MITARNAAMAERNLWRDRVFHFSPSQTERETDEHFEVNAAEAMWPSSIAGWATFLVLLIAGLYKFVKWIANWGVDIDKWDRTADALESLAGNVNELLSEIRGSGGLLAQLDELKVDVKEIKERNAEADLLVDIYKMELIDRKNRGEPMRRDVDVLIQKLLPGD